MAARRALTRKQRLLAQRIVRFAIQAIFLALFPAAFSAAFNGVKYVAAQIGAGEAVALNGFVALLVALLAYTIVFGRFFCGFACTFGMLGDVAYALFAPVRRLLHVPDQPIRKAALRVLQLVKYLVLAAICVLCFMGLWSRCSDWSPWTAFAGLLALNIEGVSAAALGILGALAVGMAFVERFFCRFFCPLGALFALMPVLPFSAFGRKRESCLKGCDQCGKNCPVGIHPDPDGLLAGECIACARCAEGCPAQNISVVAIPSAKRDSGHLVRLRGSELGLIVVKAAVLLALCCFFL